MAGWTPTSVKVHGQPEADHLNTGGDLVLKRSKDTIHMLVSPHQTKRETGEMCASSLQKVRASRISLDPASERAPRRRGAQRGTHHGENLSDKRLLPGRSLKKERGRHRHLQAASQVQASTAQRVQLRDRPLSSERELQVQLSGEHQPSAGHLRSAERQQSAEPRRRDGHQWSELELLVVVASQSLS